MGLYTERSTASHISTMMKLVVLALAVSAVCGGVVPLAYSGLPVSGLGLHGAYTGLPVHGAVTGLGLNTGYSVAAGEEVRPVVPVTYSAAPAPAIVAPQPYSVHTGTKVEVAAEPVEQHGYVIKY